MTTNPIATATGMVMVDLLPDGVMLTAEQHWPSFSVKCTKLTLKQALQLATALDAVAERLLQAREFAGIPRLPL
jgi:hypothetical protein